MRLFSPTPKWHSVAVRDVRPSDDRRQFDRYFIALCECRWFGDPRSSAARDAVVRPLG